MEDIINDARALGKKIASHPRTAAFFAAAKAVQQDKEAQEILKELQQQSERVQKLQAEGRPIEPDDKRKLAEYEARLAGNAKLKEMMKHQVEYLDMMHRINGAIDEASRESGL